MIEIVDNNNRHVAEAPTLDDAISALQLLVVEEQKDLRAIGADGAALAWGFYRGEHEAPRSAVIQGLRQFAPTRLDERD